MIRAVVRSVTVVSFIIIAALIYVANVPANVGNVIGLVIWMALVGFVVDRAIIGSREKAR